MIGLVVNDIENSDVCTKLFGDWKDFGMLVEKSGGLWSVAV